MKLNMDNHLDNYLIRLKQCILIRQLDKKMLFHLKPDFETLKIRVSCHCHSKYRTNGIKGRTFIRAALFSKTWFLLCKIWTKISSNLIEAAATNSVSTVIRIWFSSKKGLNSWGSLIYLKTCHFLLISCLICKCVLTLEVDFTRREQRLTK